MTEPNTPDAEEAKAKPRTLARETHGRWPGLVWALPLAALLIVGYLGLQALAHSGVDVVVTFSSAADAKPGDTQVVYKGLNVGRVTHLALSKDRQHVDVTLRLDPSMKPLLRQGAVFWLVGAKPSLTDISSLKAALAGVTIGFAPGTGEPTRNFAGLDQPPEVMPGTAGAPFTLLSSQVGATREGASVYYHGLEVGKVTGVKLLARNDFKTDIFVNAPYDRYVRGGTLFYNASAVQISLSGGALSTQFAPGNAAIGGGVEFDTPPEVTNQTLAKPGAAFPLFADRGHALGAPRGPQVFYRILFNDPVGDLEVGSSVTLRGFQVGTVTSRNLEFDAEKGVLSTPVTIGLEPERLDMQDGPVAMTSAVAASTDRMVDKLVRRGLRARLSQSPPLVGSHVVELADVSGVHKAGLVGARPASGDEFPVIPNSASGDVSALTAKANDILAKVQQMPIVEIGADVRQITSRLSTLISSPEVKDSVVHLDSTLKQIDQTVKETRPKIGPLVDNLNRAADQVQSVAASATALVSGDGSAQDASLPGTLHQLTDAARALRSLADYLSRHPESIIRGKAPSK